MRRTLVAAALASRFFACGGAQSTTAMTPATVQAVPVALQPVPMYAQPTRTEQSFRVSWSDVDATPGCYFFSGPGELGRDTQLGLRMTLTATGGEAQLTFHPGNVFVQATPGTYVRRASHNDDGSKWFSEETITGEANGASFAGTYHYTECPSDGTPCPGRCQISATVTAEATE